MGEPHELVINIEKKDLKNKIKKQQQQQQQPLILLSIFCIGVRQFRFGFLKQRP
jgi:hypothetical protein